VHAETGEHDRAQAYFEQCGQIAREHGDRAFAATALNAIGWLAMLAGDYERARMAKEEGLALARESRHMFSITLALGGLGVLCVLQEDFARAAAVLPENLRLIRERGDARLAVESLVAAAASAAESGQGHGAARLAGAAEATYGRMGMEWNSMERLVLERYVWPERGRLGEIFDEAWAQGRLLSLDEAIALALESIEPEPAPVPVAPPSFDLEPGTALGGFEVEELVGRGGMGVVYRARQRSLDRVVALKVLSPAIAGDEEYRARFLREARLAAAIEHDHILPVYEAGEDQGHLFLAARFVRGEDLGSLLAREGKLTPARAVELVVQIAAALDAAHAEGLVHRDVKPSNVLVERRGESEHVLLTDFGVAKSRAVEATRPTQSGLLLGSVDYVAPEQIEGQSGPPADVYSLACLLVELLTGRVPFERGSSAATLWAHFWDAPPSLGSLDPALSEGLDAAVRRGLAKAPEERFASAGELARAAAAAAESACGATMGSSRGTRND
jgi:predicted Ser/Thr protein kinase